MKKSSNYGMLEIKIRQALLCLHHIKGVTS